MNMKKRTYSLPKKIVYYLVVLIPALFTIGGCERELMDFQEEDALYFDVRRGVAWIDPALWSRYYHTPVNFIDQPDTVEVRLNVALSGQLREYARPFTVEVVKDSTNAVEGVDFDFAGDWVLPAGAATTEISMYVYKQHDLLDTCRIVVLQVKEGEYFTTDLTFYGDLPGRYALHEQEKKYNADPRFHTVEP